MSVVFITPEKHVVRETEVGRMFRRLLKFNDIFTYWNSETGQWILSYWVNRLGNVADEIEDLGPVMEGVCPTLVQQIVRCWKPVDWKLKKKMLLANQKRFLTKKAEQIVETQERYDWLKKRLRDKAPIPYAFVPRISGGETV